MENTLLNKLLEKYPYLVVRNVWTDEIIECNYHCGEGCLPHGWKRLFLLFCKNLRPLLEKGNYVEKFRFTQIKEKYGTMRLYNNGNTQEGMDLEYIYEYLSGYICENCGGRATKETTGWIGSFCKECAKKEFAPKGVVNLKKRKNTIKSTLFSNGKEVTRKISTRKYWKEYLKCSKMTEEEFSNYILED